MVIIIESPTDTTETIMEKEIVIEKNWMTMTQMMIMLTTRTEKMTFQLMTNST